MKNDKGRRQSIFTTTQVEMFILIIFILLAISHISISENNENKTKVDSLGVLAERANNDLDSIYAIANTQVVKVEHLENEILRLKGDPPCKFESGDQILMYVQFLPGRRYHFKVQEYVPNISLPNYEIYAGMDKIMLQEEFHNLLRELYTFALASDEPCRYVFKRYDPENAARGFIGEEPLDMLEFVNRYMFQSLR